MEMVTENKDLMSKARESLNNRWGLAIGATLTYMLTVSAIQIIPVAGAIIAILISGAMILGFNTFILAVAKNEEASISQVFDGFKHFGVALGAYLLQILFVLLWSLLLIIPGIIAALSYSMTFYILVENENMGSLEAIKSSKEMMVGYKWKLFCLSCRFIGWSILCVFTLGIGFLWLFPYMSVSIAQFYNDIKG